MNDTSRLNRTTAEQLASRGQLDRDGLRQVLAALGVLPDAGAWRRFGDRLLLAGGGLLLAAGVFFFFAYNWQALHRFVKLALVATPLVACAVCALFALRASSARRDGRPLVAEAWLGGAALLVGVLLAVSGQIYQSGADSELLFLAWALLILPWVAVARAVWLLVFWVLLGNVALLLYIAGRLDVWALFFLADSIFWWPLLFNAGVLVLWEIARQRVDWLQSLWGPRVLALLAWVAATILAVSWWWLETATWHWLPYTPLLYVAWAGGCLLRYRRSRPDIVPLATGALSVICVLAAGLVKHLHFRESFAFDFLLLALLVGGLTALATLWLRRLAASWTAQP